MYDANLGISVARRFTPHAVVSIFIRDSDMLQPDSGFEIRTTTIRFAAEQRHIPGHDAIAANNHSRVLNWSCVRSKSRMVVVTVAYEWPMRDVALI